MKSIILLLSFILLAFTIPRQHPVIGIFTQSLDSDQPTNQVLNDNHNKTYIAASYVKYIQMSGAQVIPIFGYSNLSYFDEILPKINGVLFPGGDVDIDIKSKWTRNAEYIMKYAMAQTERGNPFPIWGTCLGMQLLAYLTSGYDSNAISPVRGQVATRNRLQIQPENTLFKDLPTDLLYNLQSGVGVVYFNHHYAVTKEYYLRNSQLKDYWNIQAYTTTSFNEQFISTFKAKKYPFYGVQFHPEKNLFQWKVPADRSQSGAEIVQILSNKFVEIARKNTNQFSSLDQLVSLSIYNYQTSATTMSFLRIYVLNEKVEKKQQLSSHLVRQK